MKHISLTIGLAILSFASAAVAEDPMRIFGSAKITDVYRVILDRDSLLLESIAKVIETKQIQDGAVFVTSGSVQECTYHYVTSIALNPKNAFRTVKGPFEILNAGGVIANGEPHLHITLSNAAKGAFGGHLEKGCRVLYLAEIIIEKYAGDPLRRDRNEHGVSLLKNKP